MMTERWAFPVAHRPEDVEQAEGPFTYGIASAPRLRVVLGPDGAASVVIDPPADQGEVFAA
jgi:hypothetical protein